MSRARSSCPRSARTTCASSLASVRDASSSCAPRTAGRRWPRGGRQHKCAVHAAADLCGSAERLLQARRLPHAGLGRRVGCGGDLGSLRRSPHRGSRSGARPGPAVACRAVRDKADRQPGLKSGCASQRPAGGDAGPCLCGALSASCVRQVTGRRCRNEKCLRPRGHIASRSSALHGCRCGTACAPGTRVLRQRTVAVLTSVVAPPSAAKWCPCPQGKNADGERRRGTWNRQRAASGGAGACVHYSYGSCPTRVRTEAALPWEWPQAPAFHYASSYSSLPSTGHSPSS